MIPVSRYQTHPVALSSDMKSNVPLVSGFQGKIVTFRKCLYNFQVTSFLSCLIVLLSLEMFVIFISSNRTLAKAGPGMVPRLPYGPSRSPLRRTRMEHGLQDKNMDRNQSNHNTASGPPHPLIVAAISRNQLLNFLLANVLTGLVNIYVDTLSVTTMVGCAIVTAYTFVLCLIMVILHHNNISTKFW